MSIAPELPEEPAVRTETFERVSLMKRFYIVKDDLDEFGYTAGCAACDNIRGGGVRRGGISHTDICRGRIEKCVAEHPMRKGRLQAHERKVNERIATEIEVVEESAKRSARVIGDTASQGKELDSGPRLDQGASSSNQPTSQGKELDSGPRRVADTVSEDMDTTGVATSSRKRGRESDDGFDEEFFARTYGISTLFEMQNVDTHTSQR